MKNTDEELAMFARVIIGVSEEFGGTPSDDNIELKYHALKEYSIQQIQQAGTWIIKNRETQYPAVPKTQEYVDAIEDMINPQPSLKAQAEEQCDIVLKYLQHHGRDCQHIFKNKTTRYLMGGRYSFKILADKTPKDLEWWRKKFVEEWVGMQQHKEKVELIESVKQAKMIPADKLKELIHKKD